MKTLLVLTCLVVVAGCSESAGEYCDTPGVCTLPDGMVPDAKADARPDGGDAGDASPDAPPPDAGGGG